MTVRACGRLIMGAAVAIGLGLGGGGSVAQPVEPVGARAFVVWIFSHYPRRETARFDPVGTSSGAVFDTAMITLFRQNDRLTPKGDEGALDGDPICDCQDDSGLVVKQIALTSSDPQTVAASVDLVLAGGNKRTERFDLVVADGHWKIHDIHTNDTPSLRAYMTEANGALAADHH